MIKFQADAKLLVQAHIIVFPITFLTDPQNISIIHAKNLLV